MIYTLNASLETVAQTGASAQAIYFSMLINFAPIIFVIMQLVAIENRHLGSAKIALVGHFLFWTLILMNGTMFNVAFYGELNPGYLFQCLISAVVYAVWVMFGSMQVRKFLVARAGPEYESTAHLI